MTIYPNKHGEKFKFKKNNFSEYEKITGIKEVVFLK
tara:strand:- start:1404 stop:1511 length:108 start_codon:yes stop_codon:yes gene_type:complete